MHFTRVRKNALMAIVLGMIVLMGLTLFVATEYRQDVQLPWQSKIVDNFQSTVIADSGQLPTFKQQAAPQNATAMPNEAQPGEQPQTPKLLVSVVDVLKKTQQPLVMGFGEVSARWTSSLTAEVSGRVDEISDKLLVGSQFNKGDVLAKINAVDYESALAEAEANLAAANVSYLEQQRETEQAKKRWDLSGLSGQPSALTLQTPQLTEALAALNSAKAALVKAEKNVSRTTILSPFNGRVSSRAINPGEYVSAGMAIGVVYATDIVDINIAFNAQQFALIGTEAEAVNQLVDVVDTVNKNDKWTAKVARFEYHIDKAERTRNLVLEVNADQASTVLMPGTFIEATIPGKAIDDLLKLPASALSRDGYIWYVDRSMLQRFKADIKYKKEDYLAVSAPNSQTAFQIVCYPQSAFIVGQIVEVSPETLSEEMMLNKTVASMEGVGV